MKDVAAKERLGVKRYLVLSIVTAGACGALSACRSQPGNTVPIPGLDADASLAALDAGTNSMRKDAGRPLDVRALLTPRPGTKPIELPKPTSVPLLRPPKPTVMLLAGAPVLTPHGMADAGLSTNTVAGERTDDFSCLFGSVDVNSSAAVSASAGDEEPGALIMSLAVGVAALACGSAQEKCRPPVLRVRDGLLTGFRGRSIQYDWRTVVSESTQVGIRYNSEEFGILVLALFGHEYGHYMDLVLAGAEATTEFCKTTALCKEEYTIRKRRELWADSISGCVLARSGAATNEAAISPVIRIYERHTAMEHPAPEDRRLAMLTGWERCDSVGIPTLEIARRAILGGVKP